MEHQINQAVEIALSGTSDPSLKNQAIDFINQIKSTQEGYQSCLNILLSNSSINEQFKFFIFQVIEENLSKLNQEDILDLNRKLFKYVESLISSSINESNFLKNKFTEILSKIFCLTYLNIYPDFLKDYLQLIESNNNMAIDYYLRLLISIHQEIGDKLILRSKEEQERNTLLKDQIRVNDMNPLVLSWNNILRNSIEISDDLSNISDFDKSLINNSLENCLIVIGQYVNWMDINLFVNNDFFNMIFQVLIKNFQQKNQCCLTIIEILSKKMKPENKLQLISLLNITSILNDLNFADADLEFLETLAKLTNQIGYELCIVIENSISNENLINECLNQFLYLWPFIFNFLINEYDEISVQVFPFIQYYLILSKKLEQLSANYELFENLLNKIILKMKFDSEDDGEDMDSVDEFNEFRSRLKTFQDSIAIFKPDLYLNVLPMIINQSVFENVENDWRNLELGLYELSNFCDSIKNNLINLPKNQITTSKPFEIFTNFLIKLINSDIILNVNHNIIQINFFELVIKNFSSLNNEIKGDTSLILKILQLFTSEIGLFNENEKVRVRTWYLFFRYIKLVKPVLNEPSFIEDLLTKLQPLLIIKAQLPTKDDDLDIVELGNFNNQLYLFESVGLLVSLFDINEILKLRLIDIILQPLFNDLEGCIKSGNTDQLIVLQIHHVLMAIGTFARGYDHETNHKYSPEVVSKFSDASQVVIITLENFSKFETVRDASRFSFARFIPILNENASEHLSKLISLVLASANLKSIELVDFISFINQIIHVYQNNGNIYQLLNDLFTPLIKKIFEMLEVKVDDDSFIPDIIRDKNSLKKSFLNLLTTLFINHQTSLLITETNKQVFPEIISKVFEFGYDLSETSISKLAIGQLTNLINVFNNGRIIDPMDKFCENLLVIEGIDEYLINNSTSLCFELPFKTADFDLKDAQYRLICQEIALLLKTLQLKKNEEFLTYLSQYLTETGLSNDLKNDFGTNLLELDQKAFKKYFIAFVTELKGQ